MVIVLVSGSSSVGGDIVGQDTLLFASCYRNWDNGSGLMSHLAHSLRAGSLVWVGDKEPRTGEKNEARKSEPARDLLIFEFRPSRGVKSAFHMCQITIQ